MAIKCTHHWFNRLIAILWKASALSTFWMMSSFSVNSQTSNEKAINSLPSIYCIVMLCDAGPNLLQPQPESLRLQVNAIMQIFSFSNTGSSIHSCSITPALPAGLVLDAMNCDISGTPMTVGPATLYTITASNDAGASSVGFTIEVVTIANSRPNLIQPVPSSFTRTTGSQISSILLTNTGGPINSCAITPSLPLGLTITSSDCTITGFALATSPLSAYTVTALNSNGASTINITLEIISDSG